METERTSSPLRAATWRKMPWGRWLIAPRQHEKETLMSDNANTLPLNAETANAIVNALGAVVFATVRALPPEQRAAFANDLARLAKNEERQGQTASETILLDLHRAAVLAAS